MKREGEQVKNNEEWTCDLLDGAGRCAVSMSVMTTASIRANGQRAFIDEQQQQQQQQQQLATCNCRCTCGGWRG